MLKIDKAPEPQELIDFKKKSTIDTRWEGRKGRTLRKILRPYILEHEQNINGSYCCVYCERKVTVETSHIEHIKPKSKFREDIYNYENLTVSCETESIGGNHSKGFLKTCGHYKGNRFDEEKFINPVQLNPEDFFTYDQINGKLLPLETLNKSDQKKAEYTIDLLNLNDRFLLDIRTGILDRLLEIDDREQLLNVIEKIDQFPGLYCFFKNELFDLVVDLQNISDREG